MTWIGLWMVTFALGTGDALLTGLAGLMFGGLFFLLVLPLALRRSGLAALSGLLTGFGATWLVLLDREAATGGQLEGATGWVALGAVALLAGLLALAPLVAADQSVGAGCFSGIMGGNSGRTTWICRDWA